MRDRRAIFLPSRKSRARAVGRARGWTGGTIHDGMLHADPRIPDCSHGHASATPDGGFKCLCAYGFEGERCETDALAVCAAERRAFRHVIAERAEGAQKEPAFTKTTVTVWQFRFAWHNARWTCDMLAFLDETDITCGCLSACALYLRRVQQLIADASGTDFTRRAGLGTAPACARRAPLNSTFFELDRNFSARLRASLDDPVPIRTSNGLVFSSVSIPQLSKPLSVRSEGLG